LRASARAEIVPGDWYEQDSVWRLTRDPVEPAARAGS